MARKWLSLLLTVITLALFLLLVKLGFWQLDRAQHKQQLAADYALRAKNPPLTSQQLLTLTTDVTGYQAKTRVSPSYSPLIYLDNQTYQGQVGYLVYQLMQIETHAPLLLVELGFIAGQHDRSKLPKIKHIAAPIVIEGKLYQKQLNPVSYQLFAEPFAQALRIQNLNIKQLSQQLNKPILPFALQLQAGQFNQLAKPWKPIPMPAKKHLGYAVQWFGLAAAFIILVVLFKLKGRTKNNQ